MTRFFEKNTFLFFNQHYYTLYLGDFNVGERRTNNFENYINMTFFPIFLDLEHQEKKPGKFNLNKLQPAELYNIFKKIGISTFKN